MNSDGNKPLCPHCFRENCPWLVAYSMARTDFALKITTEVAPTEPSRCPHGGHPLLPGAKIFLRSKLEAAPARCDQSRQSRGVRWRCRRDVGHYGPCAMVPW